jgi:hypothetical protein
VLEGDRSIASDAAVMAMALASPSLGQSMDIYGRDAKTTTHRLLGRDRAFGKRVRNVRSMGRWTIDNKDRFSHESPRRIIFATYPVKVAFR